MEVYKSKGHFRDAKDDLREVDTYWHGRYLHASSKNEDCRRFSVYHTYVTYEDVRCKIITDGGSICT